MVSKLDHYPAFPLWNICQPPHAWFGHDGLGWVMLMVALSSQYDIIGSWNLVLRSLGMILIERSSQIPCVMPLNSASTLEWATTNCFLLL